MNRRRVLHVGTSVIGGLAARRYARGAQDVKITRITSATVVGERPWMIGKNARLDDHGQTSQRDLVRIFTDSGHEAMGVARDADEVAQAMIGKNPLAFYDEKVGIVDAEGVQDVRRIELPLWDLIGKVLGKPLHQLWGGRGGTRVPAYDGSIYFADILHPDQGVARIEWEIDQSMQRGHRGFKLKVGRGHKWMPPEEGFRRDVEVINAVRRVAGPKCKIGIDANNGYDLAGAKRLLGEVGDRDIVFAEEMFPEQVDQCLEFKQFLRDQGLKTLLADGESATDRAHFIPYLEAKAFDVVQADMGRLGPTEWFRLARLAEQHGVLCAPHNWGWQFGYIVILHFGAAIPNFLMAETDPVVFDAYDTSALKFAEGIYTLPDLPGYGVGVNEDVYTQKYAAEETVWE